MCRGSRFVVGLLVLLAFAPPSVTAQATLRVAAYNIKHGRGMDEQVDLLRMASIRSLSWPNCLATKASTERTDRTREVSTATRY
jgi:endonuclease/exonuclease/phosphatase family metal-dependent hydrolase